MEEKDRKDLYAELNNTVIRHIYRTAKPRYEFWFNGLGNLKQYVYIMELEDGRKYAFVQDLLWHWEGR